MAYFIKPGFWEERKLAPKHWLNLDQLIKKIIGNTNYSREVLNLPVPTLNQTVNITPSSIDTIVVFNGPITANFTININASASLPGNRMYIFLEGLGKTVTFTGDISLTLCGDEENTFTISGPIAIEEIFNGINFIGIDNC